MHPFFFFILIIENSIVSNIKSFMKQLLFTFFPFVFFFVFHIVTLMFSNKLLVKKSSYH